MQTQFLNQLKHYYKNHQVRCYFYFQNEASSNPFNNKSSVTTVHYYYLLAVLYIHVTLRHQTPFAESRVTKIMSQREIPFLFYINVASELTRDGAQLSLTTKTSHSFVLVSLECIAFFSIVYCQFKSNIVYHQVKIRFGVTQMAFFIKN